MTRIAHLTDLHLLEAGHASRSAAGRLRLEFLSLGRPLDPDGRRERLARALDGAWAARADHVCITGDLTEDGHDEQFVALAEVLHASRFAPYQVTIVPGNHDAYDDPTAWARALEGPLASFAATSVGATIDLGDTVIAPMSTMIAQPVTRSAGALDAEQLVRLDALVRDPAIARRTLVVAQHHPPMRHCLPGLQWIDGLLTHATMRALVESAPHASVLYGHTHREKDGVLRDANGAQAFSAEAVVDSEVCLRLYEARDGRLTPLTTRVATPAPAVRLDARPQPALAAA